MKMKMTMAISGCQLSRSLLLLPLLLALTATSTITTAVVAAAADAPTRILPTVRSYNKVDYFEFDSLDALQRAFFSADGNKATTNVLLGEQQTYACMHIHNTVTSNTSTTSGILGSKATIQTYVMEISVDTIHI